MEHSTVPPLRRPIRPGIADPLEVWVIDSHTGGEPTRVVMSGFPDLGSGSVAEQAAAFHEQHDRWRAAIINEPRGSDVLVGALLTRSSDPSCIAGAIFFNNVGLLGMCGHGLIGLIATLAYTGQITAGQHRIETPVGTVTATLHTNGEVSVQNVPSFRKTQSVAVQVHGLGTVTGDVAWGGNWFFLCQDHGQELTLASSAELLTITSRIRVAVNAAGYPEVDHVELFGPALSPNANSRNFVLCPGGAYDRSPCGTGTSAKLACLAAEGALSPGQEWVQESIVGSCFRGSYEWQDAEGGTIVPTITGTAFITAEALLLLDPCDPFRWSLVSQ
jgi:4-hydroxyproline epimerase